MHVFGRFVGRVVGLYADSDRAGQGRRLVWTRPHPAAENLQLQSINAGLETTVLHGDKSMQSGICKRPVLDTVFLGALGVAGDVVLDETHHGGPDQAVYAYSADDYDWWAGTTDRDFYPGLFGENLTIRGLPTNMNVGDRLLLGEVVLEVTGPRIPCSTLATRMKDPSFGLAFRKAERPGIYFRVLNEGAVAAGDTVVYVASENSDVSILDIFRFYYALGHDAAELGRFLDAPVAARMREKIQGALDSLTKT